MKIVDLKTLVSLPIGTIFFPMLSGSAYDQIQILDKVIDNDNSHGISFFSRNLEITEEDDLPWKTGPNISPNITYHVYEEDELKAMLENTQKALASLQSKPSVT